MEVTPLAADSLGVRSLSVAVETGDRTVVIDPGASLGPRRDGRHPHVEEYRALKRLSRRIDEWCGRADVIVVTHYHFDHYVPSFENYRYNWSSEERAKRVFRDSVVLAKHTENDINYSQRKRGYYFDQVCEEVSRRLEYADGGRYEFGDLTLTISPPVPHGVKDSDLGYVLMVAIDDSDETLVYTSDVQGPVVGESSEWILEKEPDLLVLDGPPTYLSTETFPREARERARDNIEALAGHSSIVVDHHLLRDREYSDFLRPAVEAAEIHGNSVVTAAEYLGRENQLLEARRRRLHESRPVPDGFYDRVESGYYLDNPLPD